MSNYLTTDTDLTTVANAIRAKGGTSASLSFPAGYVSAIQNISTGDIYEPIYKSLAYRSIITSSASLVSEWCNSLSVIKPQQFAGQPLSGNFAFNNVTSIKQYAFAWNYVGGFGGVVGSYTLTFPKLTSFKEYAAFAYNQGLTSIYCPSVTNISSNTFYCCNNLISTSFPVCTTIDASAFCSCKSLTVASFPSCVKIGYYAFSYCSNLTSISFPVCTSIGAFAFANCSKIETAIFPSCTLIGTSAFYNCISLTSISFPVCTSINSYAFNCCSNLTSINFPSCITISYYAFCRCINLTSINFSLCTTIGSYAFSGCSNLTSISFPVCTTIGPYVFSGCTNLISVSFPACVSIGNYIFSGCFKLSQAYFMGSSIVSIGAGIFYNTPMQYSSYLGYFGSIYVPSSLLNSYKTATNWAQYSSRMVGI